ncbi:DUF4410 domain-containing protein [Parasphingopyxis marina]|uniref:DUF4410 domain-containing protein n=1 Tax=Parasphingopyxis marina TaxID=2761622 RepID=A0A842I247_9SPHN|nr:DUF4410 domain-containing protein [Parasphingopyxis marina]MBC2777864.1 DUF4410 domain-containing protein [Parasphingopyxis marina]
MTKIRSLIAAVAATIVLSACAGSSNMVISPNRTAYTAQSVTLEYDGGTIDVEQDSVDELQRYMDEEFFGDAQNAAAFARGSELTVRYGFMTFDEGSQAARYFLGGLGGGEARMVVRAEFFDPQGNSLAVIQSEGRLGGGFFGGDAGSAIRGAAREIATYAVDNFGGPSQ